MTRHRGNGVLLSRGSQNLLIVILLALAVLIVLGQANPMTTRLGRDSGMYAYIASRILRGGTPYLAAWDSKPPAAFFIDAAGLLLGGGTRWGIWGMEFVFLLGAAITGFFALKRHFGLGPAVLSSIAWLGTLTFVLEGGNLTEEYSLFFSFGSLWLFTLISAGADSTALHALLGVAFGCGFLTRPNNTGVQFAIILTEGLLVVLKQRPLRQTLKGLIATGIGFIVPLAVASLYFVSRHAFEAFLDASLIYNLSYGGQPGLLAGLLTGLRSLGPVVGIALLGMWMAFERLSSEVKHRRMQPIILWLCLDFIVELLFSGLSGRNYPHYFICWLPWMAFACALPFGRLLRSPNQWADLHPAPALAGAIAILSLISLNTLVVYGQSLSHLAANRTAVQWHEVLPSYVNEHTAPGDTVLAWGGEAGINFLAGRDAPTAHFEYGILVPSEITDRISAQFYQDLLTAPPALILDGSLVAGDEQLVPLSTLNPVSWSAAHHVYAPPYLQEFFDFVHQNYTYRTTVAGVPVYFLIR